MWNKVKVNKDAKITFDVGLMYLLLTLNICHTFLIVSIIDFEIMVSN